MDKTRQERYNMIYGNTARKIEDLAAEPVRRQPRKTRKAVVAYTTDANGEQNSQNLIGTDGNVLATERFQQNATRLYRCYCF